MGKAVFIPHDTVFKGDYDFLMRDSENEFKADLHYHDFYECVVFMGAAGLYTINDREYLIRRGDIVLIDIFKPHRLQYNRQNPYERYSLSITLGLLLSFSTEESNLLDIFYQASQRQQLFHLSDEQLPKYIDLFDRFKHMDMMKHGCDLYRKALAHMMLSYLYNDCYTGQKTDAGDSRRAEIITDIFRYVERHLTEEISLAKLAEEVNYSEYYISRLFRRTSGMTLTSYIQDKRVAMAAAYIDKHISIAEAAERSGFNNYSYFFKTFRKIKGCSPKEYQDRLLQQKEKEA